MKILRVLVLSLVIVAAFSWYLIYQRSLDITGLAVYETPELSVDGYLESEIRLGTDYFDLVSGCRKLTMITTDHQVRSIKNGFLGKIEFRPTTHDLINDIFENYGIEVLKVKVTSLQNGAYFADLILKQDNRFFSVDSRPSDAIALAVRQGAPVYVSSLVMEEYGEEIC